MGTATERKEHEIRDREMRILIAGLAGSVVQGWDDDLDDIAALTPADGNFIVGNGSDWITESGNTARTSLGLGTGDSPTFTGLTLSELTKGSVLFAGTGGRIFQDNTNFFFDNSNDRLGVGVNDPSTTLEIMSAGGTGNDFANDANCVALWRWEGDSVGTNDLAGTAPEPDVTYVKEGESSSCFEGSDEDFEVVDENLSADFPFKDGTSNKTISLVFWMRPTVVPTSTNYKFIFSKYQSVGDNRSFAVYIYNNGTPRIYMTIGYNGGADGETVYDTSTTIAVNRWYHVGITFQDSDGAWRIRIYDEDGSSTGETTGNFTQNININAITLRIGSMIAASASWYYEGYFDEMAVFDDVLSAADIDAIRSNTYNVQAGGPQFKISYDGTNYISLATESITSVWPLSLTAI
jgi:hypothetical protein